MSSGTVIKMYGENYKLYGADCGTLDEVLANIDADLRADRQLQVTMPVMMMGKPGLDLRRYVEGKSVVVDTNTVSMGVKPKLTVTMNGKRTPNVFVPEIGRDDKWGKAAFAVVKDMPVCVGATYERGHFTVSVLSPFIHLLYPSISMAFLSSEDIKSSLDALDSAGYGDVIVDSYTYRSKLDDKQSRPIRTTESTMRRTDRPYREVFETTESVDRIQFRLIESGKSVMDGYISRNGILRFKRSFLPFSSAMWRIAETVSSKTRLYSNRSRSENGGKVRPLVIEVADSPFKDRAEGVRLISTIRSMRHTSSSLYHSNPYIHMFLVDFRDGSSFDIWVVSDGEVTIVPQIRATAAAVGRLTSHIMKEFREGHVREHERSE